MFLNNLFYIVLFLTFFLPNNTWFTFGLGSLSIREIGFILLPIINKFCDSPFRTKAASPANKRIIILIFVLMFITEYTKSVFIDYNLVNLIKSFRICLPVLSILSLVYSGFKANFNKIIKTFFIAIIFSILISFIGYVFNFQFLINNKDLANNSLIIFTSGRFLNDNAEFGIIGLLILFKFKDKKHPHYMLIRVGSILSVLSLILAFNRTYLIMLLLEIGYLSFVSFNILKVIKIMGFVLLISILLYFLYSNSYIIKNQINDRIIMPYTGDVSIRKAVIENNRDIIYQQINDRISEGYWLFGLPMSKPIWIWNSENSVTPGKTITDISFINILLRFGITILFLYSLFLFYYYRSLKKFKNSKNLFVIVFPLFLLASFNIDSLMFHNSIFFVFLFSYLYFNKAGYFFFENLRGVNRFV